MSQVKLNLKELSVTEKLQLTLDVGVAMSGNAHFSAPNPTLLTLSSLAGDLQSAVTAKADADQAAKMATVTQRNAELALDNALAAEAAYVQNVTKGDEAGILSAGMDVRSSGHKRGPMPAPMGLSGSAGDLPGEIDLHWDPVYGASSYAIQQTVDPLTPGSAWTVVPASTRSKVSVTGLTPGTRYWFEVAAVGAAGQGPWSAPATKMAQG